MGGVITYFDQGLPLRIPKATVTRKKFEAQTFSKPIFSGIFQIHKFYYLGRNTAYSKLKFYRLAVKTYLHRPTIFSYSVFVQISFSKFSTTLHFQNR